MTIVSAIMNGMTPLMAPLIGILATPHTTLSTVPTGGVTATL